MRWLPAPVNGLLPSNDEVSGERVEDLAISADGAGRWTARTGVPTRWTYGDSSPDDAIEEGVRCLPLLREVGIDGPQHNLHGLGLGVAGQWVGSPAQDQGLIKANHPVRWTDNRTKGSCAIWCWNAVRQDEIRQTFRVAIGDQRFARGNGRVAEVLQADRQAPPPTPREQDQHNHSLDHLHPARMIRGLPARQRASFCAGRRPLCGRDF
jgi:hypothetical protein